MTEPHSSGRPNPAPSPENANYPAHWEADVLLSDGGVVHLRPVRADDGPGLVAMHDRTSDRSKYLRYFQMVSRLSPAQLDLFLGADQINSICLVAQLGDDLIAAGTFYRDERHPDAAEVAFLVEDAQQSRGLGSILLEHLTAAARERGIREFTAEVLTENRPMIKVFLDAGYAVSRHLSSGVVDLHFDIAPTAASLAVITAREHRAEARSLQRLLNPASIAVIGASTEPTSLGHIVLRNLLAADFSGPVFPVNPHAVAVQGVRAYPTVLDIPDPVDLAVIAVPAAVVSAVVEDCRAKHVHGLVVISAGFADADEQVGGPGAAAQRQLVALSRANGMRVVGPNCLGVVNTDPAVRLNASLAPTVPPPGNIGFFSQSGTLGIAILADAAARGLGLSSFVSAGNRADVSGNDLLQYWADDPRTDVVLLYLESFGNPRKFARLAKTLARTKPVVAVKSGRHQLLSPGVAASAVAVPSAVVDTLFAQAGVIRTQTLDQAFDVAQLLARQPLPSGRRIAVVGNSTALGILAADACLDAGLLLAPGSPVDLGFAVAADVLADHVRAVAESGTADGIVMIYMPPATSGPIDGAGWPLHLDGLSVPVVSTFPGGRRPTARRTVATAAAPAAASPASGYRTPERAVAALVHAVRYREWLDRPPGRLPAFQVDIARAEHLVHAMLPAERERALADNELAELLHCYGIEIAAFAIAETAEQAVDVAGRLGFPVVLKAVDQHLRHRVDRAGIRLHLPGADQVRIAYEDLLASGTSRVYVQVEAPPDRSVLPTVLKLISDPSFGAVISFGLGGMATDLLDDFAYQAVPLTDADAADLIRRPKAAPLLAGYRGADPVDREALAEVALRLSQLADDLPEIIELELNPVLVGPGGACVTGATGRIGPANRRADVRRRLR